MIKRLSFAVFALAAMVLLCSSTASAAAQLPAAAVWFAPSTAAVGSAITLNALVYNNQSVAATVTVSFTDSNGKIAAATETIAAQSAKTVTAAWTMPAASALVTATVTTAVNANNQSLPALLGVIGTTTVGTSATPLVSGISLPSSPQIVGWFSPFLGKVEQFRVQQAAFFTTLSESSSNNSFSHFYAIIGVDICTNPVIFYIAAILVALLLLRFIVNLIF